MKLQRLLPILLIFFAVACGGDDPKKPNPNNTITDAGHTDGGVVPNGATPDGGVPDSGDRDAGPVANCSDDILNGDESDVDCGGSCDSCELGAACGSDDDCESSYCSPDGVCQPPLLATGETCETGEECASGQCKEFGDASYCTESCTDTCPGQNLACFRDECTPNTYCDDPDGDGFGFGPGCDGQPCDRCADDATCSEQGDGSFTCLCNDGFDGDGESCTDIDECSSGANDCDTNATCTNSPGSFSCACNAGFEGDGTSCSDIDECATGADNCDVNAACTNQAGTFSCACDSGFDGDGTTCIDIDECATGADTCADQATCTNIPGSFTCACDPGYMGNGFVCNDIDECSTGADDCDAAATCTNTPGSFTCACPAGYTGDGTVCTDIDECSDGTAGCDTNATCTNTAGSFTCACDTGYTGDGFTCTQRNECIDGTAQCGSNTRCVDLPAGYTCICDSGYEGDPFAGCTNIDECARGTDPCSDDADCADFDGGVACTCKPGFTGNGFTCADVDECAMGTDTCDDNAVCTNDSGGFSCACEAGYVGDGFTCTLVGDTCAAPVVIGSLPFQALVDTTDASGATDDYAYGDNACPGDDTGNGGGINDVAFEFTPATSGNYIFEPSNSDFSERLYLVTDCASVDSTCLGAEFFGDGLNVALTAGTTYFLIVDGGFTGDEGTLTLDVYEDVCVNANPCDATATCSASPTGATCACGFGYVGDGTSCTLQNSEVPLVGEVVFSEVMYDPLTQTDNDGEWFEIYNASARTVNLDGCRITDPGEDEFIVSGSPDLAAGDYMVFARSSNFAGTADYVYNDAFSMSSFDDLEIECLTPTAMVAEVVDEIYWGAATFPTPPSGRALSLDPGSLTAVANDDGANWCQASTVYNVSDYGTPGAANPVCP